MEKTFSGQILCSCAFGANIHSYTKQRARHGTPFLQPPPPPSAGVHVTPPPRRAIFRLPSTNAVRARVAGARYKRGQGSGTTATWERYKDSRRGGDWGLGQKRMGHRTNAVGAACHWIPRPEPLRGHSSGTVKGRTSTGAPTRAPSAHLTFLRHVQQPVRVLLGGPHKHIRVSLLPLQVHQVLHLRLHRVNSVTRGEGGGRSQSQCRSMCPSIQVGPAGGQTADLSAANVHRHDQGCIRKGGRWGLKGGGGGAGTPLLLGSPDDPRRRREENC